MKKEIWFIDTNVIMYARGREHPYKAACSQIIFKIADGSFSRNLGIPAVDTEVFQEIIYRYSLEKKLETAIQVCRDLLVIGPKILPVDRAEVETTLKLAEKYSNKGVHPRDLVHTAVMINNKIKRIITADTHFDIIEEVERVDPLEVISWR